MQRLSDGRFPGMALDFSSSILTAEESPHVWETGLCLPNRVK